MRHEDYIQRPDFQTRPPVQEVTLREGGMEAGGYSFFVTLKQNFRGRFLRITEKVGPDFTCLIVPAPGLPEFTAALEQITGMAEQVVSSGSAPANPIQVQVERKCFEFALSLDQNGWFLVIVERGRGKFNQLIVPLSVLFPFTKLTGEMAGAAKELPPIPPDAVDETLKFGSIQFENREFKFLLKRNIRGVLLRITEAKDGHSNSVIVPAEILAEFKDWVVGMAEEGLNQAKKKTRSTPVIGADGR